MQILTSYQHTLWTRWLLAAIGMVVLMVLIGGLTRLTESGLSIVEWKVFSGVFPPLSQAGWEAEFAAYKLTPEFQKINSYFGLAEFKRIFWLEYIHRVLGRITGLVFLLPLLYFAARRHLPPSYLWRMFGFGALVALQGVFGWIMVKSGLVDDPRVSPLKLSLHLSTAFLLFSLLWWQWLHTKNCTRIDSTRWLRLSTIILLVTLTIQIIFGAWVAGWDAGLTYNTWPLMNDSWVPEGLTALEPIWRNPTENITTVQFQHRMLAIGLALPLGLTSYGLWRAQQHRLALILIGTYLLQFKLGVLTLIYVIPISLASAHQMGALLLLAVSITALFLTRAHAVSA